MRAFLSHSSKDKGFVSAVANELGRQFCVYDEYCFTTGAEFREAIRRGLDESSIFVLIASKNSLAAPWVQFEQDEAELRTIQGNLSRILIFLMPDGTTIDDLPVWMRRVKVSEALSAKAVVREIQHHIQEIYLQRQQPIYVGRQKERLEAETKLLEIEENGSPRVFFVWGLAGIGRRTFATKLAADLFNLKKSIVFRIKEGDDTNDLAIQLAEQAEVINNISDLKSLVDEIRNEEEHHTLERITRYIENLVGISSFPIFLDMGGMVDSSGDFTQTTRNVFQQTAASPLIYCSFALNRKPRTDTLSNSDTHAPVVRIQPLENSDIVRLLGRLASAHSVTIGRQEINELAEYLRGYPPAAHFAIDLIRDYGAPAILANKVAIATFQSRRFVAYLEKHDALSGLRSKIMSLLCLYSPLPLAVLGRALDVSPVNLSEELSFLIDISLVIPDSGMYRIADPVVDSVLAVVNRSEIPHAEVAESLKSFLEDASMDDYGVLAMARALRRANLYAGLAPSDLEVAFASDLIELQKQAYHDRDYEASVKFGIDALSERPSSMEARSYLVRGLAQLERYTEAIAEIEPIRQAGLLHDAYFLRGFIERLQGNTTDAITAYLESLKRGRRGLAIHRELALCYFLKGDNENARVHLDRAAELQADNRYIIDLQIQIAIRQGDVDLAYEKLEFLREVDNEEFYFHRKSTVELVFGKLEDATNSIDQAISLTRRPTAAMVAQAARCEIENGNFESAETCLKLFREKFPRRSEHALPSLECRYEIARGEFRNALAILESKVPRELPIFSILKLKAVSGLLQDQQLDPSERNDLARERARLEEIVGKGHMVDIDSEI